MIRTRQMKQLVGPAALRKQWIEFALLIGGTGLILAGLSVGLAFPIWHLLFQALRQFPVLQAQQGIGAEGLLLLLIMQASFSLASWVLLIWIAVRGGVRLRSLSAQINNQFATQPTPAPAVEQAVSRPTITSAANSSVLNPSMAAAIIPLTKVQQPSVLAPSSAATALMGQPVVPRVQVTLMLDQNDTSTMKVSTQHSPVGQPAALMPKTPVTSSEQQQPMRVVYPKPSVSTDETVLPPATLLAPNGPVTHWQKQPSSPALQPKAQRLQQPSAEGPKDPFAINEDAVKMFLENPILPVKALPESKLSTNPPRPEFVFGNPFEGLLPDVFEHDEDLKRSIKEQHLNIHPRSVSDK